MRSCADRFIERLRTLERLPRPHEQLLYTRVSLGGLALSGLEVPEEGNPDVALATARFLEDRGREDPFVIGSWSDERRSMRVPLNERDPTTSFSGDADLQFQSASPGDRLTARGSRFTRRIPDATPDADRPLPRRLSAALISRATGVEPYFVASRIR